MKGVTTDVEAFHLGVADLDAFLIDPCVEGALDFEPGLRRCGSNQFDDGGMIRERPAAPILGDATEQAMLDLVPFCCSRWVMSDLVSYVGLDHVHQLFTFSPP